MGLNNNFKQFYPRDVEIKARDIKYQGFFRIDQYQLKHRLFNGNWSDFFSREIFERGDAVVLIPFDSKSQQVMLIQQFRAGAVRTEDNPWCIEFIAGMFGENESPIEVAIREAQEEAELDIKHEDITHVMNYLSSPGGTSEKLYMYLADIDLTNIKSGTVAGLDHENEDIKSYKVSLDVALQWLADGKINNASTIIGLQWLAMNANKLAEST